MRRPAGTRGRPKVRSDQEQKDIIIGAAMDIFLKVGFAAMKMDHVASACTVSKRTLYRLFPSKLDLFRSLVAAQGKDTLNFDGATEAETLEDALLKLFRVDRGPQADLAQTRFVELTLGEMRVVPQLGTILYEEGFQNDKRQLAAWLADWKDRGAPRLGDPYAAASLLIDLLHAADRSTSLGEATSSLPVERNEYLRECIRYFVHGVT
jgi:AcrR family transcriptional regulator